MDDDPDIGALTRRLRRENAEYIGVTTEEFEEMGITEIRRRIAEKQKEEFIEERWFGQLRFRIRKWLVNRVGSQKPMFTETDS